MHGSMVNPPVKELGYGGMLVGCTAVHVHVKRILRVCGDAVEMERSPGLR
jgi:hypothetical protein